MQTERIERAVLQAQLSEYRARRPGYDRNGRPLCSACGWAAAVFYATDVASDERYCEPCWCRQPRRTDRDA